MLDTLFIELKETHLLKSIYRMDYQKKKVVPLYPTYEQHTKHTICQTMSGFTFSRNAGCEVLVINFANDLTWQALSM